MQMGFVPGKGMLNAIFSERQMMKKYDVLGGKLYISL